MGKAYNEEQRICVKSLLEAGRDEAAIEKETGVSDRTIRRWKLELERTGRIGKPPESRTGRHRVLTPEMEDALFDHVKNTQPDMSVDDMLWWLWEEHKIVVGTRTIRRVFERKGDKLKGTRGKALAQDGTDDATDGQEQDEHSTLVSPQIYPTGGYQSPYAPMAQQAEQHMAQVLQHHTAQQQQIQQQQQQLQQRQQQQPQQHQQTQQSELDTQKGIEDADDEETLQLELERIGLQKREVELKLRMRRLQQGKNTPTATKKTVSGTPQSGTSTLYNPHGPIVPTPPKRDSRSKKKIAESEHRTRERQARMLRDLERRSRRRHHLTAEWVQSKDIWPLRAQGMVADLMHQYGCYAFSQNNIEKFEAIYRDLYQLVDLDKGDWVPQIHDEMLRERMKRKMGQLRNKMQKTGEIVGRGDAYDGHWRKANDYTGEAAGQAIGDENEMPDTMPTSGGSSHMQDDSMSYDPVADHQMQHGNMPYGGAMMQHQGQPQYPMMPQHPNLMPYGAMDGSNQEGMVL